jgi:Uma2 family endonuclease
MTLTHTCHQPAWQAARGVWYDPRGGLMMNPTAPAASAPPRPVADPFAIGWRDVPYTLPDGTAAWKRVPLTLEDALHPQEGDTLVENSAHNRDCRYLQDVFERRLAGDRTALVLGDCKVLWEDGVHHSPDVAVILGVREAQDYYSQFDVRAEGARPRLIVEVVSPNTRVNDVVTKLADYHRYRVPVYVIVDREDEGAPPRLLGYERTPRRYRPIALEDDGRLWLEPLGVYLGVRDNRVVVYDGQTEQELGDYTAVSRALADEQARAEAERQRAESAEARIRQLEAELQARQAPPRA